MCFHVLNPIVNSQANSLCINVNFQAELPVNCSLANPAPVSTEN